MKKVISLLIFLSLLLGVGIFFTNQKKVKIDNSKIIRIGLSLSTLKELRWQKDRDLMAARASQLGANLIVMVADNNDETQISQIENLISQKVDVIIVVAHNANALSETIKKAKQANIKVIAYDRMLTNSLPDLYISFDSFKVGALSAQYILTTISSNISIPNVAFVGGSKLDNNAILVKNGAMSILDPLIKSKKIKLVYDQFTTDWNGNIAHDNFKQFLARGGKVDGVIVSNDGMAFGIIDALKDNKLAGKIPVTGQDADLPAIRRLLDGTQTLTLYKPIYLIANKAIDSAVSFAKGESPNTVTFVDSGIGNIPSYLVDPIPVTKDNIKETVVKDGFYSQKEIYE